MAFVSSSFEPFLEHAGNSSPFFSSLPRCPRLPLPSIAEYANVAQNDTPPRKIFTIQHLYTPPADTKKEEKKAEAKKEASKPAVLASTGAGITAVAVLAALALSVGAALTFSRKRAE